MRRRKMRRLISRHLISPQNVARMASARELGRRGCRQRRALGDHARWVAFIAPYGALCATLVSHGFQKLRHAGVVYALVACVLTLPFWRAWCGRPVFAFYGLALRRYWRKCEIGAFEEEEKSAAVAEALRDNAPAFTRELAAFVRGVCESRESDERGDGAVAGAVDSDARQPSEKMRDAGWVSIPLHDATLDSPSRLAAKCFPSTSSVVASVGGFNGKVWVLRPGAGGASSATGRVTTGLSDGYWRAHVVLARDAGLHGKAAGLRSGDETRALELGSVHIVNDFHPSAFWNVSRDSGVVLLSFDVVRPEREKCRAAIVETRARLTRAFGNTAEEYSGDVNFIAYVWRVFSLTFLSNLS